MKSSSDFEERIEKAWGRPARVAKESFDELFRRGDEINLDHDDLVRLAMQIGLLAGETKYAKPEIFIKRFEAEVLNGNGNGK